jgi:hypothetical protein
MLLSTMTEATWNETQIPVQSRSAADRTERIMAAVGPLGGRSPRVDENTLSRYYRYLTARLSLPFTATYPVPTTPEEEMEHRCTVVELLDPARYICDEFDGIFCKTRKGRYEINLPLTELRVPEDSPNFQLIEDYSYWFWNWR